MSVHEHLKDREAYRRFYMTHTRVRLRLMRDFFRKLRGACGILPKTFRALSEHPRYLRVEEEIARRGFQRILEVGCGLGMISILLAHRLGVSVTGVDLSPLNIAKAKALCWMRSVQFFEVFAEDLTQFFPHASFDCILFPEVLEHVISVEEVLSAVSPLLAPGGSVLVTLPNDEGEEEQSPGHVRMFDNEEIRRIFGHFPAFHCEELPVVPGVYAGGYFVRFVFSETPRDPRSVHEKTREF